MWVLMGVIWDQVTGVLSYLQLPTCKLKIRILQFLNSFVIKRPCQEVEGRSHVAHLNFKTSGVSDYKCLSLIVSFAVTVAIWPQFGLCHLSEFTLAGPQ